MNSIIFYNVAEYCDYTSKLTIKQKDNQIRTEFWDSINGVSVETKTYLSTKKAYRAYLIEIGLTIEGGWKVLNALPQKETWETKRSK